MTAAIQSPLAQDLERELQELNSILDRLEEQQAGNQTGNLGALSTLSLGGPPYGLGLFANATDYDMQFLDGFLKSQVADTIRKLYQYVRQHSELVECVPLVTQCVQFFGQGQYAKALSKGYEAYRCIQAKL